MLKKITFSLIAILGSASALAGHGDDMGLPTASGVNLVAPRQEGSWSFGAQANYFEPNNDLNYAFAEQSVTNSGANITDNTAKTYAVDSDYEWGWGVDITYHFPGDGRDVTLAYTQLDSSQHDSVDLDDGDDARGWQNIKAMGIIGTGKSRSSIVSTNFTSASGKVSTDYDAVDLTFGQLIMVGKRVNLHPFAGLRWASVDYKGTAGYEQFDATDTLVEQYGLRLKSDFDGVGPRLGSDAAVNLGSGFSLRGTVGVSLLVGDMDVENEAVDVFYSGGTTLSSEASYDHDVETNTRVVPEADAKLSAMYHADFNNGYGLGFELGWQVTNYFDAIQNGTVGNTVDTTDQYTNFFMQGPYARIQLDVA